MPTSGPSEFGAVRLPANHQDANLKGRSQRFLIQAALRYRERGETAWNEGTVVNISRSGLLFRTARELQVKTVLEMQIHPGTLLHTL
jgi:hypothetical protein